MAISTIIVSLVSIIAASPMTQVPPDDPVFNIDSSAIVTSVRKTSGIEGDLTSGLTIDPQALRTFPKLLGTSDPLKYAQALPGVTTSADFESGLHIQGCEISQSITKICDAPVYGQGHLLGLFSVFNPGHFKKMSFAKNTSDQFIGGELKMDTADTLSHRVTGETNIGPVSSHIAVSAPIGSKSMLTLSARRSLIDVFYKSLIKIEGGDLNYYFYDLNGSYLWQMGKNDKLDVNFYYGKDSGNMSLGSNSMFIGADWSNAVGNVRWRHDGDSFKTTTQIFSSTFFMTGNVGLGTNSGWCKDSMNNSGISTDFVFDNGLKIKAKAEYYGVNPQQVVDESSASPDNEVLPWQNCVQGTVQVGKSWAFGDWTLYPTVSAIAFGNITTGKFYPRGDADLKIEYNAYHAGKITLDGGVKSQYIYMTGMTNSGFPVEFWMPAGVYTDPQEAAYATLGYDVDFNHGMWSVNLQAYGKRLWNQTEYTGFLTDMMGGVYDLGSLIKSGDGYNYGTSVMLQKNGGNLTGWISYTWGRAMRKFDDPEMPDGFFPSSHERQHELNAVASYKIGKWELGSNFILASGLPYTPVTSVYYLNNTLMVKYGDFNSKNLSPYIRLDISVNFNIRTKGKFHDGVNISIQNATARKNQLMTALKVSHSEYSYAPVHMIIPILPSINYYCNF